MECLELPPPKSVHQEQRSVEESQGGPWHQTPSEAEDKLLQLADTQEAELDGETRQDPTNQ